jgi:hypothetical protein
MTETDYKEQLLITYIHTYLSKRNLRMKRVLIGIVNRLKDGKGISERQYNSIIKFIERELKFVRMNRSEIRSYFDPLILDNISKETNNGNDLTKFFI